MTNNLDLDKIAEAEEQVEAFIRILGKRYGIKENEIPEFVETLRWSITHRDDLRRISWHAILGIVGALVTAFMLFIWEGVKHNLHR